MLGFSHRLHRNLSNTASLLWHAYKSLPSPSKDVNWAGKICSSAPITPSLPHRSSSGETYPNPRRRLFSPSPGFYVLDPSSSPAHPSLVLGPFQGKVACQTIAYGRGVCGTAAATRQTQLVPDVDAFPGHIACDGVSKSEIVVPITVEVLSPAEGHAETKVVGISE